MAVDPQQQRLKVNLHNTIPLLIRESDLMIKMDLPVPLVALTLYTKQDHFNIIQDALKARINQKNTSKKFLNFCFLSFW